MDGQGRGRGYTKVTRFRYPNSKPNSPAASTPVAPPPPTTTLFALSTRSWKSCNISLVFSYPSRLGFQGKSPRHREPVHIIRWVYVFLISLPAVVVMTIDRDSG
jgi:hypothetical protein